MTGSFGNKQGEERLGMDHREDIVVTEWSNLLFILTRTVKCRGNGFLMGDGMSHLKKIARR